MRMVGAHAARVRAWLAGATVALALTLVGQAARAGCCDVVKVDPEIPAGPVRVCEPDASGQACEAILFDATLALGARTTVCADGDTILYQEIDPATGAWAPLVTAVCEGGDVEL